MTHRGKHTLLNYIRFVIPPSKLHDHYVHITQKTHFIITSNHLNVVDSAGKLFLNDVSPAGFAITHLLDESHFSAHAYTDKSIGKLAVDLFTCSKNPVHHYNAIIDINTFFIRNYMCVLDSYKMVDRF